MGFQAEVLDLGLGRLAGLGFRVTVEGFRFGFRVKVWDLPGLGLRLRV